MIERQIIVPPGLEAAVERFGYAPAVKVGDTLYCSGQLGRTPQFEVIVDPEQQFVACWENVRKVLTAGGATFDDVVDITTFHVNMSEHFGLFLKVREQVGFPKGRAAWTAIGVAGFTMPGLLVEIKCVAVVNAR